MTVRNCQISVGYTGDPQNKEVGDMELYTINLKPIWKKNGSHMKQPEIVAKQHAVA